MHSRPSDVIAEQIRKHRERVGLTREQLAQECAKLGAPELTFGALTNIETGRKHPKTGMRRRDVTVEELQVIAYALAVPLLELMFPLGEQGTVPVPPEWQHVRPLLAWRVAMGEEPPSRWHSDGQVYADHDPIGEGGPTRLEAWQGVRGGIQFARQLGDQVQQFLRADARASGLEGIESEAATAAAGARRAALEQLASTVETAIKAGMRVPPYPAWLVDEIRRTGLVTYPEALTVDNDANG